jgi:very-short-patch-repair endonuclease
VKEALALAGKVVTHAELEAAFGSKPEQEFAFQLKAAKLPEPVREFKFHPERKWRLDFAWTESKVALEIEGGTWINGRHTRGSGFEKDCEKYGHAALLGWRVIRVPSGWVKSGRALQMAEELLRQQEPTTCGT